jgi:photosynthetic reaction center M subunit
MPPLNDGGWYIIASFFLLVSRDDLVAADLPAARRQHKMGKHIFWAFARRSGCSWCWACSGRS